MKKARVKANRKFKDIELNKVIKPNEIYVVSFERAKEIAKHPKNLIEIIDVFDDVSDYELKGIEQIGKEFSVDLNEKLNSVTFENDKSIIQDYVVKELNKFKLNEIKDICKEKGIKTSGTKKELIERLIETQ